MTPLTPNTVEEIVKNDERLQQETAVIANGVSSGEFNIAQFVEQLGFALTSPSVEMRVNGMKLLSSVLKQLPADCLNVTQLTFLAVFYADRLKDHHNAMPAIIDGIEALSHMPQLPGESVVNMLSSFFQHTTCQSQVRGDRSKLFGIFQRFAEQHAKSLQNMGADFICGLINAIDGERDPRNLDFIFSFMPALMARFPLLHLAEEMFEIFACYFPIDFNPSSTDPDTITRDKLSDKLADCLVASPDFTEWTVTLALEKLDSDLVVAKLDSLALLQRAYLSFKPQSMAPYFAQIWNAVKAEIFPGRDNNDVIGAGMLLLRTLLEQAALEPELSAEQQTAVLGVVLPQLNDVNQRLFNPAASIALVCVAGDAAYASEKILNTFLLKLQTLRLEDAANDEQRIKIYANVAQVYKIAALRNQQEKIGASEICMQLQADVIAALRRDLTEGSELNLDLQRTALCVLGECAPQLGEAQRALVYRALTQLVLHASSALSDEFKQLLECLAALQPVEVQTHCLDVCLLEFPRCSAEVKRKIYSSMLPLAKQLAFTQRVLDFIMSHIFQTQAEYVDAQLLALEAFNALLQQEDAHFVVELQHNANLIEKLVQLRTQVSTHKPELLQQLALALRLLVQHLSVPEQYIIADEYLPALDVVHAPADLYVAHGLLSQLHADISLDAQLEPLLDALVQVSLAEEQVRNMRLVAQQLLCSLANKTQRVGLAWSALMRTKNSLLLQIKASVSAVETLAWLAKALIVRGDDEATDIIHNLLQLLDDPSSFAEAGVRAFEIVTSECTDVHLPVVKILYKQKLFHTLLAAFEKKINGDNAGGCSSHHLNAFMHVIKTTQQNVLRIHMEKIGPVLFKGLEDTCDANTIQIALGICASFVKQQDVYFGSHLNHIIPSCLKLAKTANSMQVRIDALNLLTDLTKYPTYMLLPHKLDTALELANALDDRKRWVRRAAATARNAWYMVGVFDVTTTS